MTITWVYLTSPHTNSYKLSLSLYVFQYAVMHENFNLILITIDTILLYKSQIHN